MLKPSKHVYVGRTTDSMWWACLDKVSLVYHDNSKHVFLLNSGEWGKWTTAGYFPSLSALLEALEALGVTHAQTYHHDPELDKLLKVAGFAPGPYDEPSVTPPPSIEVTFDQFAVGDYVQCGPLVYVVEGFGVQMDGTAQGPVYLLRAYDAHFTSANTNWTQVWCLPQSLVKTEKPS